MSPEEPQTPSRPPAMQLMGLLWPAAMAAQAIHVAAKLGVADLVSRGPKTVAELAEGTRTHESSLGRLLRALTSLGIFTEDREGRYSQSALSDALRADHPQSMHRWAMMLGAGFIWRPSGELDVTIRTGQPAFEHVYGAQFFNYLAEHADEAAVFNAAMSSLPVYINAIVDAYDFSKFERIVDIGGGHGALLVGILTANSRLRGVLQDLPGVVAGASVPSTVADRLEIVAGDFFEAVPVRGRLYIERHHPRLERCIRGRNSEELQTGHQARRPTVDPGHRVDPIQRSCFGAHGRVDDGLNGRPGTHRICVPVAPSWSGVFFGEHHPDCGRVHS